jgi:putative thiazole-containing bacteriocin maturation protein
MKGNKHPFIGYRDMYLEGSDDMTNILQSARLKVNQDTSFTPDSQGGVYFRNNTHTFRMHGSNVYQWMEKLIPILDGEHTISEITAGLPDKYQQRVFEFAQILLQNGYIRDISQDKPHQLTEHVQKTYAQQINYLDHLLGSGGYHFEQYRKAKVLLISSAALLPSLISSSLQSGVTTIYFSTTDNPTIERLYSFAADQDKEMQLTDYTSHFSSITQAIQSVDAVLYMDENTDKTSLSSLIQKCKNQQKPLLSAIVTSEIGVVGAAPDIQSAWKQISLSDTSAQGNIAKPFMGLLANQLAFLWFRWFHQLVDQQKRSLYLLNPHTLEGKWSHVSINNAHIEHITPLPRENWTNTQTKNKNLLHCFTQITSPITGIFHSFRPENHLQLPLSQFQVRLADATSFICAGWDHEEAGREAGLTGVETHAKQSLCPEDAKNVSVGAGESIAEAFYRALIDEVEKRLQPSDEKQIYQLSAKNTGDDRSRYYAKCIETISKSPILYKKETCSGFPVIAIKTAKTWESAVGVHFSDALQTALQKALHKLQLDSAFHPSENAQNQLLQGSIIESAPFSSLEEKLAHALEICDKQQLQLDVFSIPLEEIIEEHLYVLGVRIREEEQE